MDTIWHFWKSKPTLVLPSTPLAARHHDKRTRAEPISHPRICNRRRSYHGTPINSTPFHTSQTSLNIDITSCAHTSHLCFPPPPPTPAPFFQRPLMGRRLKQALTPLPPPHATHNGGGVCTSAAIAIPGARGWCLGNCVSPAPRRHTTRSAPDFQPNRASLTHHRRHHHRMIHNAPATRSCPDASAPASLTHHPIPTHLTYNM